MTQFVAKRFVHMNRFGTDQSTLDAGDAYITGTFRVGGDITLGDEITDLIHVTGVMHISGTFEVGEVGLLPPDVGFFVSGSPGSRGLSPDPTVALFGGDVHISGNLTVDGTVTPSAEISIGTGLQYADFLTGFGEGATSSSIGVWQLSTDPLSGSTEWTVGVITTRDATNTGDSEQRVWSTSSEFLGGGATFVLRSDGAQPRAYFTDPGNSFRTVDGLYRPEYRASTVFSVIVYEGGNVRVFANGYYADGALGSNTGQAYTTHWSVPPFTVGASGIPSNTHGAEDYGIHAICYVTRSLSTPEILDWWRHVYVSGTLVDIPNSPDNGLNGAWRVSHANPLESSWSSFIGNSSLIKTGSKPHAVKSIPLKW
jgi:hypothetical protein